MKNRLFVLLVILTMLLSVCLVACKKTNIPSADNSSQNQSGKEAPAISGEPDLSTQNDDNESENNSSQNQSGEEDPASSGELDLSAQNNDNDAADNSSQNQSGEGDPDPSGEADLSTQNDDNESENNSSQNQSGEEDPTTSGESDLSTQNNDNDLSTGYTIYNRVSELISNVDKFPSEQELFGGDSESVSAAEEDGGSDMGWIEYDRDAYLNDGLASYYMTPQWPLANMYYSSCINWITDQKDLALGSIYQLNTWIIINSGNEYMRLSYDLNSDTAAIELLGKYVNYYGNTGKECVNYSYTKIMSSYTSQGKVALKATSFGWEALDTYEWLEDFYNNVAPIIDDHYSKFAIEYIEDDYCRFAGYETWTGAWGTDDNYGVIYCPSSCHIEALFEKDFKSDNDTSNTFFRKQVNHDDTVFYEGGYRYLVDETGSYLLYSLQSYCDDEALNFDYGTENQKRIFSLRESNDGKGFYLTINANYLSGWDQFRYKEDGSCIITIDGEEYTWESIDDGYFYLAHELTTVYEQTRSFPEIQFPCAPYQNIDDFLLQYGLTCNGFTIDDIIVHAKVLYENTSFMNYEKAMLIDSEEFDIIYDKLLMFDFDKEGISAFYDSIESPISLNEQQRDTSLLSLFDPTVGGKVSFDENGVFDFSSLEIDCGANALIVDQQYKLIASLRNGLESHEIAIATASPNEDKSLTFEVNDPVSFAYADLSSAEYDLVIFIQDSSDVRISNFILAETEETEVQEFSIDNIKISVSPKGNNVIVKAAVVEKTKVDPEINNAPEDDTNDDIPENGEEDTMMDGSQPN